MNYNKYKTNKKKFTMDDVAAESTGKLNVKPKPLKLAKKKNGGVDVEMIPPQIVNSDGETIGQSPFKFDDYIDISEKYNSTIRSIDKRFSEYFEFVNGKILLRMYMEVPKVRGMLMSAPQISVPNKSGHGFTRINKNYPFTNKGVVISSSVDAYKLGDEVVVDMNVISEIPLPGTESTYLPSSFVHPDGNKMTKNDQFGYILCQPHQIYAKIKNKQDSKGV